MLDYHLLQNIALHLKRKWTRTRHTTEEKKNSEILWLFSSLIGDAIYLFFFLLASSLLLIYSICIIQMIIHWNNYKNYFTLSHIRFILPNIK